MLHYHENIICGPPWTTLVAHQVDNVWWCSGYNKSIIIFVPCTSAWLLWWIHTWNNTASASKWSVTVKISGFRLNVTWITTTSKHKHTVRCICQPKHSLLQWFPNTTCHDATIKIFGPTVCETVGLLRAMYWTKDKPEVHDVVFMVASVEVHVVRVQQKISKEQ